MARRRVRVPAETGIFVCGFFPLANQTKYNKR